MNAIEKSAILYAKTGVFYANCDGEYDERERDFITRFVDELEKQESISGATKAAIGNVLNTPQSFADVIKDTRDLLQEFNEAEQKAILYQFNEFIKRVIDADGKLHPNEEKYFEEWKNEFMK